MPISTFPIISTGHSRYVDFAYLQLPFMSKWFFIPNILSLYFFAFQLCLCRKRLTWSNGYLEVIFHAVDIFSIIFATVYFDVKVGARIGAILSASAMYMLGLQQYIVIRKYCNTALSNTLYCIGDTWFAVLQYGPWMGFFCVKTFVIVSYHKLYSVFMD